MLGASLASIDKSNKVDKANKVDKGGSFSVGEGKGHSEYNRMSALLVRRLEGDDPAVMLSGIGRL